MSSDRAHRIGQIRDVHIYRFISQHTVEEAMLKKANQKRSLDDLVIQKGEFDWRSLFSDDSALTNALGEFEDMEDAHAAAVAAREEVVNQREDEADFGGDADADVGDVNSPAVQVEAPHGDVVADGVGEDEEGAGDDVPDEGGTIAEYMVSFIGREPEFFKEWRL
jgi:helicase SWR1